MEIVTKFSAEAFRYYFLRECPFPGDGEFSWKRFEELYNADLANNLGNTYSRVVKLITQHYDGRLEGTAGLEPGVIFTEVDTETTARQVQTHIEACQYNQALQRIWLQVLNPTNKYLDDTAPWKLVKTDKTAAKRVLYDAAEQLRVGVDPAQAVPAAGGRDHLHQLQLPRAVGGGELRGGVVARPAGRGPQGAGAAARRQGQAAVPAHRGVTQPTTSAIWDGSVSSTSGRRFASLS